MFNEKNFQNRRTVYGNFVATAFLAMTPSMSTATDLLPRFNVVYQQCNASSIIFLEMGTREIIRQDICYSYRPRTALGAKLMALRRAYIENGGALLDDAAFEAELRSRRGGVDA
jgi:hypothetical protein